ncbi:MAG: hypothetical protein AAF600_10110 [Bacteroidota bacterium]
MTTLRSKIVLTGIGILFLVFYLIFYRDSTVLLVSQKNMCRAKSKALDVEFSGVLIRKYEDRSDHLKKKVEISSNGGIYKSSFLASEVGGFFEKLIEGDSLVKEKNSLEVRIFRDENRLNYLLDFMCSER